MKTMGAIRVNQRDTYLINQVFSAVIVVILGLTFYIMAVSGLSRGIETTLTPMLLIIIAIVGLALLSEVTKMNLNIISAGSGGARGQNSQNGARRKKQ
jgi:hypothetical protein